MVFLFLSMYGKKYNECQTRSFIRFKSSSLEHLFWLFYCNFSLWCLKFLKLRKHEKLIETFRNKYFIPLGFTKMQVKKIYF